METTKTADREPTGDLNKKPQHPAVILAFVVLIAAVLTWIVPSGSYERDGKNVLPESFTFVPKDISWLGVLVGQEPAEGMAAPVGLTRMIAAIPAGIVEQADLIFMVMFIGAMFGVLQSSRVLERGLDRLLGVAKGNIYVLVPVIMVMLSFGSTFLGMAKEFLLVIPMVLALTNRFELPKVIGLAIVAVPVKVGYLASIINPYALTVAQPLAGVPVFSGMWLRVVNYVVMMIVGIAFVLWTIRSQLKDRDVTDETHTFDGGKLSHRDGLVLSTLGLGIVFMVFAAQRWGWGAEELSAYYLTLGIIFGVESKMGASQIAEALVSGMKKVLIAAVLIGLATSVAIILKEGQVLDSIIHGLAGLVGGGNSYFAAYTMVVVQLLADVAIPSTSGQAAVTMPILGPVGQLTGVTPNTTVLAFLIGNGLTNIITPTSSGLLIFLATAEVSWTTWFRYVWRLFLLLMVVGFAMVTLAVAVGY